MSSGRTFVGHPVDVGSGAVFTKRRDFRLAGTIPLDWVRHYSTDCDENGWLGRRWSLPFSMRLERRDNGLLLTDETGRPLLFPTPQGRLPAGGKVFIAGANMELSRVGDRFEILHWHFASDDVERFAFNALESGAMPLAWIENLTGHRITLDHDARGRPVRLIQQLERREIELKYDRHDLLADVHFVDDSGDRRLLVHYDYDAQRRLVASTDALGYQCRYAYDERHRLVAESNPLGSVFHFRYDKADRCTHTWGDDGYMERRLDYLIAPPMTRVTDSLGHTNRFLLNAAGQVIQEVSPLGAVTTREFDEHGRPVQIQDPDGGVVRYGYDDRGNRTVFIDELGGTSKSEYDDLHLLVRFTDPTGACWSFERDRRGNLMALINPIGARQECVRDERGLVVESRQPGGLVMHRRYGENLRSLEVNDQFSTVMRLEVDELGNQIEMHDGRGLLRRIANDALGRPIEITDAIGRVTRLRYNGNNDLVERVLPGARVERWQHDRFGRLIAHENAAGTMQLAYDNEDHLVTVVNRIGERLEREYDPDGRMVSQTFFDGRTERYDYSPRGLCMRRTKADGREISNRYDPSGTLIARTSSDGLREAFVYDANGKIVAAENPQAHVEIERDRLGRVVAEVQNGWRIEYQFDIDNNRIGRKVISSAGIAAGSGADIKMRYDVRGRLRSIADVKGVSQEFDWDDDDILRERRLFGGSTERFEHDALGRQTRHHVTSRFGDEVFDQRLAYDESDRLIARLTGSHRRERFAYDPIGRLLQVSVNGVPIESYSYDPNGSVVATHRGHREIAPGARELSEGSRRWRYGRDGCIDAIEDESGRIELLHDVDGRLTEVRQPNGSCVRYAYDPLGRRILKESADDRVEFVWQSCSLAAEYAAAHEPVTYFHHDLTPLAQWIGNKRRTPVFDQIGLPCLVLDEQDEVLWRGDFDAYGRLRSESGTEKFPVRFRGQYRDFETGLHYNFHRHFDPTLAGYLSPDPIGLVGGSNFYAYPRNPLLWDDPFGLTCSNQHKGQMGENEMDAHYVGTLGYTKIGGHVGAQGIDGVYHNPNGTPPYIIAEAKYGSSRLGNTVHSGRQMSDHWIDTPIGGGTGPTRLISAVGIFTAADIQHSASTNRGSVRKEVFNLPAPGTPGTGQTVQSSNYTPNSGVTTF